MVTLPNRMNRQAITTADHQPNTEPTAPPQKKPIFRQAALDRVSSPEQLDQLIQVISPKHWLSLLAFGALVATGLGWSIVGRIPITVSGRGVLVYPSQVRPLQSTTVGKILDLKVEVGKPIKKGQIIATIDQSELQQQLQLTRSKLVQLQLQDQLANTAQLQRQNIEQSTLTQQRKTLEQSLNTVQSLTPVLRDKGLESIKRERQSLQQRLQNVQDLLPVYRKRWDDRQRLFEAGAIAKDTVLQAQQDYIGAESQINEAEAQLKQLDVREADTQRDYLQTQDQANQLETQIAGLESQQATQKEQDMSTQVLRQKEIQETERMITQLELQLKNSSQIISSDDGHVLELNIKPGQQVEIGMGLGSISTQSSEAKLRNVSFLPVSEGKKIKPGMQLQLTPTTLKREEFGGILAKVDSVSEFPVTQQAAASLIGNPDVLSGLMGEGPHVVVISELQVDPKTMSGYRWSSSQGPKQSITTGTTTTGRVTIEERAPIAFVLPILKSLTGAQ
jgi:HlyD family secretion protein